MKKKILKIFIIIDAAIIVLVIAGLIIVQAVLGDIVELAVESQVPSITKTSLEIGSIGVSPLSGSVTIKELALGNPEGYAQPESMRFDLIHVDAGVTSLLSDIVVVDEIRIEGAHIGLEQGLTGNNLLAIKRNVDEYVANLKKTLGMDGDKGAEQAPSDQATAPAKQFVIKKMVMTGAVLTFAAKGIASSAVEVPLPDIELTDIGNGKPIALAEFFEVFLDAIYTAALSAGDQSKVLMKGFGEAASGVHGAAGDALEKVQGWFD